MKRCALLMACCLLIGCSKMDTILEMTQQKKSLPSVDALLFDLSKSSQNLGKLYETLERVKPEEAVASAEEQLANLESCYQQLGEHDNVDTQTERKAQMIVMQSHYVASKILPSYKRPLATQAKRVIELRPETNDAAVARVLLFCTENDLGCKVSPELLHALATEAGGLASPSHGVGLYSVVAHEFWKNGYAESAEKVLQSGIAQFPSSPEKIRLVNQMIDQGHRKPPKPKITPEQFARMQRAIGNSQPAGGAIQFRS